jgi:hypothetical protein
VAAGANPAPADVDAARAAAVAQARHADAVIVAVGEGPYAEGLGDTDTAALPADQAKLIDDLAATGRPVIVVVIAGRPLMMGHRGRSRSRRCRSPTTAPRASRTIRAIRSATG